MKITLWPKPEPSDDHAGPRIVVAQTVDVIDYEIANEDNHPSHLHEFVVTSDNCGTVQLSLHDGAHRTKLWLDREMAQDLIDELRKAIDEATDFNPAP
jgi:hypothetical protein